MRRLFCFIIFLFVVFGFPLPAQDDDSLTLLDNPDIYKIVEGIAFGDTTSEIADKLGVSRRTIENHLSHIYDKIGVKSKEALIACLSK